MRLSHAGLKVLRVFLDNPGGTIHGYELMAAAGVSSGTLYPLLMRLESVGWLSSSWEQSNPTEDGRPRRRQYRLTGTGQRAALERFQSIGLDLLGFAK